ncbi:MAG: hypothetical protein R3E32_29645 [Chitinophagales bacterium]
MEVICLDSTVPIDYYRKTKKENSFLFRLAAHYQFKISSIVKYEVYRGDKKDDGLPLATLNQKHFERIDNLQIITPKDL